MSGGPSRLCVVAGTEEYGKYTDSHRRVRGVLDWAGKIDLLKGRTLIELRKQHGSPAPSRALIVSHTGVGGNIPRWEHSMEIRVTVNRQPDLLQVITALGATGRVTSLLHRREQQGNENSDNGDHHQQFNQRECPLSTWRMSGIQSRLASHRWIEECHPVSLSNCVGRVVLWLSMFSENSWIGLAGRAVEVCYGSRVRTSLSFPE